MNTCETCKHWTPHGKDSAGPIGMCGVIATEGKHLSTAGSFGCTLHEKALKQLQISISDGEGITISKTVEIDPSDMESAFCHFYKGLSDMFPEVVRVILESINKTETKVYE